MFCNACGTRAPDGASFCAKCGGPVNADSLAPVTAQPAPVAAAAPKSRIWKWVWIGLGAVIVAWLGLYGTFLLTTDRGRPLAVTDQPTIAYNALSQHPEHVEATGERILFEPSEAAYGLGGQGTGKPDMRPPRLSPAT